MFPKKIAVFAHELPYPPIYGGIADIWNRIQALRNRGCEILLVAWQDASPLRQPTPEALNHVRKSVMELQMLTYRSGPVAWIKRAILQPCQPAAVTARLSPAEGFGAIEKAMRAFDPDVIWVEPLTAVPLAHRYSEKLKRPYFIRSHNVEHKYTRLVNASDPSLLKRCLNWFVSLGFERYELRMLKASDAFFDISLDDLRYWRSRGLTNGYWLPPTIEAGSTEHWSPSVARYDVSYLGSLNTVTNVEGLAWFCREVAPLIRAKKPDFSILISGSRPNAEIKEIVNSCPGATLVANVESPSDAWNAGRVLINPCRIGSGVNVKSIQMLFMDRPMAATRFALRGLPNRVGSEFFIGETKHEFAAAVLAALETFGRDVAPSRLDVRDLFASSSIDHLLNVIRRLS